MDVEGVIIDHHQISYKSGYPEDYCIYLLKKGHTFPSIINLDSTTFPYFASYIVNSQIKLGSFSHITIGSNGPFFSN